MVKHYDLRGIMVHCVCYQQSIANKKHGSNASRFIRIASFACKQLRGGRKICAPDCKVQVSSSSSLMNYLREILLNPGHMTTCRRCRPHLVLTPPRTDPHYLFLTLYYPLYSSLYPLPRQQYTYHGCRPCRQSRQTAPI